MALTHRVKRCGAIEQLGRTLSHRPRVFRPHGHYSPRSNIADGALRLSYAEVELRYDI